MTRRSTPVFILLFALLVIWFIPSQSAFAAVQDCTEAGLDAAIAAGGEHTFNCTIPTTIVITASKSINSDVTLDGGGLLTISGNNLHRIFYVESPGKLTLRNLTLTNGYAVNNNGGAVQTYLAELVLDNVTVANSEASYGGGISALGRLTINNSTINNNKARNNGGGVYVEGGSIMDISGSAFTGNTAQTSGGGIFTETAQATITASTFTNNQAVWYGGAYCHSCDSTAGGIRTLNVSDSVFSGNITGNAGGALYNGELAHIAVLGSSFASNRAGTGGAVANLNAGNTLNVANSTFSGNIAIGQGGAIFNNRDVYVSNVTFVGNTAPAGSGGGLYAWDWKTRVKNSLFANNSGGDCAIGGGYTSFTGENNLSDTTCTGSIGTPTHVDLSLANNGGATQTHALRHRTNAYNAVPNCTYLSGDYGNYLFTNGDPITTDQRGMARLGTCDIGAYEYYGPVITTEPQEQTIVSGTTTGLSVVAEGPGTLTYQWYQGAAPDTAIPAGADSPSYTTPALTADTPFWVRVTNEYDSADSFTVMIWMNMPPQITHQPTSQSITPGGSVVLSVTASGTPPLAYQWYAGDSGDTIRPIDGATDAAFITPPLYSTHRYWVRVSNVETTDSETATITVEAPLTAAPAQAYFTAPTVTLTWNGTGWASGYEVWVARDRAFAQLVHTSGELSASTLSHDTTLSENGTYYWKVRARKPDGVWGGWSAIETFVLDLP